MILLPSQQGLYQPTNFKQNVNNETMVWEAQVSKFSTTMLVLASFAPAKEAFENIKHVHLQACTWKHIPLMQI